MISPWLTRLSTPCGLTRPIVGPHAVAACLLGVGLALASAGCGRARDAGTISLASSKQAVVDSGAPERAAVRGATPDRSEAANDRGVGRGRGR